MMSTVSRMGMIRRTWSIILVALTGMGALGLISCAQATKRPQPHALVNTGKPVLHAIMSDELKAAMARLNRLSNEDMRAELYSGDAPDPHMDRVAAIATDMAKAAEKIPSALGEVEIAPEHKQLFLKLADELHNDALELHEAAFRKDVAGAQAAMYRANATCNACHELFREMR